MNYKEYVSSNIGPILSDKILMFTLLFIEKAGRTSEGEFSNRTKMPINNVYQSFYKLYKNSFIENKDNAYFLTANGVDALNHMGLEDTQINGLLSSFSFDGIEKEHYYKILSTYRAKHLTNYINLITLYNDILGHQMNKKSSDIMKNDYLSAIDNPTRSFVQTIFIDYISNYNVNMDSNVIIQYFDLYKHFKQHDSTTHLVISDFINNSNTYCELYNAYLSTFFKSKLSEYGHADDKKLSIFFSNLKQDKLIYYLKLDGFLTSDLLFQIMSSESINQFSISQGISNNISITLLKYLKEKIEMLISSNGTDGNKK